MMRKLLQSSLVGLLSLNMGALWAAGVKPNDAIEYRQSVYTLIKWNFAPIGAMLKGQIPYDAAAVARHTAFLETLSKMPLEGFTPGSDVGNTKAKPDIWKNRQEFEKLMSDFQEQVIKLNQVAGSGDQATVKEQFNATAKSCKNCHDKFRKE